MTDQFHPLQNTPPPLVKMQLPNLPFHCSKHPSKPHGVRLFISCLMVFTSSQSTPPNLILHFGNKKKITEGQVWWIRRLVKCCDAILSQKFTYNYWWKCRCIVLIKVHIFSTQIWYHTTMHLISKTLEDDLHVEITIRQLACLSEGNFRLQIQSSHATHFPSEL